MKKITCFFAFLFIVVGSFSQERRTAALKNADHYMKKSREQKSAAWSCLGIGSAMILGGNLIGNTKTSSFDDAAMGVGMGAVGVLTALYSLRLFAASANNKNRALYAASLKMQRLEGLQLTISRHAFYPAVQVQLQLGK
jgi:hypothetical protein